MMEYHVPVLLKESIDGLQIRPDGIYVDATFGGGGHARAIADKLDDNGHLFVFDQDEESKVNLWDDSRVTFILSNFRYLHEYMQYYGVAEVHGVLADLGVSSWQFDQASRGFSYREPQSLDMRMNREAGITASDILQQYEADALMRVFSEYGEIRNTRTLVNEICKVRARMQFDDVQVFIKVIEPCIRGNRMRYLSQVFQALRIEVNDEYKALAEFLPAAGELLSSAGRLVVISYHSGEDRMVKRFVKGTHEDRSGKTYAFDPITKKPITPTKEQVDENIRARSALLRIAEKR